MIPIAKIKMEDLSSPQEIYDGISLETNTGMAGRTVYRYGTLAWLDVYRYGGTFGETGYKPFDTHPGSFVKTHFREPNGL